MAGTSPAMTLLLVNNRPRSLPAHGLHHLVGVAGDFHLVPDVLDLAFLVDEESGALDAHVFAAIHALLDPDAVFLGDLAFLVRGESEGQLVFLLELVVALDAVTR